MIKCFAIVVIPVVWNEKIRKLMMYRIADFAAQPPDTQFKSPKLFLTFLTRLLMLLKQPLQHGQKLCLSLCEEFPSRGSGRSPPSGQGND